MKKTPLAVIAAMLLLLPRFSLAADAVDTDGDGLTDDQEIRVYHTDPLKADTDGDGFPDGLEIKNGFNPNGPGKLSGIDTDGDGLSDADEILFGVDLANPDTDGDGFPDGAEVAAGYDPLMPDRARLQKHIEIALSRQQLTYYIGPKALGAYPVSTGRPGHPTPLGTFAIASKSPRAWSKPAHLWMPWWMAFYKGQYGIHELPEWPGGKKEGANHLGTPVSGGCVRLGIGPAKLLYDWADIGTQVVVKK